MIHRLPQHLVLVFVERGLGPLFLIDGQRGLLQQMAHRGGVGVIDQEGKGGFLVVLDGQEAQMRVQRNGGVWQNPLKNF